MITKIILVVILLCSMIIPVGGFLLSKRKEGGFKAALASNIFFFFGTVLVADVLLFNGNVQAAGEAAQAAQMWKDGAIWQRHCPQAFPVSVRVLRWQVRQARLWVL